MMTYNPRNRVIDAIKKGDAATALDLLSDRENINAVDVSGISVLMWATVYGYTDIVKELVAKGASVNHKDKRGKDVFWVAENFNRHDILEFLRSIAPSD